MTRVKVRCTVEVEIPWPEEGTDEDIRQMIEEHDCPGTGRVGVEIEREYERGQELGVCWACNLKGENKVLEILR